MKIIAVLGPYYGDGTRTTIAKNIKEAESYAIALANLGIGFFCPHTHTRHFEELAVAREEFYHELDLNILSHACDAALFTPRWSESKGATREHLWCVNKGLRCFFPSSPQDLMEIIEWDTEVFKKVEV